MRDSLTVHVALYALQAVEWQAFRLTLDGEPISALLLQGEMKEVMELEWMWDARSLPPAAHTLEVTVSYLQNGQTRDLHVLRVFDLSEACLGQSSEACFEVSSDASSNASFDTSSNTSSNASKRLSRTTTSTSPQHKKPQRVHVNTPAQRWTMTKLRWLEPLGALFASLALSLGTLLLLKHPRALLAIMPSSAGKRVQQLRSNPALFALFFTAALSLAGGTYFCGVHDHSFVCSLLWGTLTYSRDSGWNFFFWTEVAMWSLGTNLCVLLPMLTYCLLRLQPLRYRFGRWAEYGCLLLAVVYTLIQTVLIVGNFSPSLWLFSWNAFWLPPLLIAGSLLACGRKSGGEDHVV